MAILGTDTASHLDVFSNRDLTSTISSFVYLNIDKMISRIISIVIMMNASNCYAVATFTRKPLLRIFMRRQLLKVTLSCDK